MVGLNEQGATILMVTHDPVTASYAERVLFVKDGELFREIHQFGTRKEFFEQIMEVQRELGGAVRELV